MKRLLGLVLLGICFLAYDPTRLENSSGDTISNRYWPIAVLKYGEFKLDFARSDLHGVGFSAIFYPNGDLLPRTDLGMSVFSFPFYALADAIDLGGKEWSAERINRVSRWNAIVLSLVTLAFLYLLLCKMVDERAAFVASLLFGLGTYHWSLAPQGLSTQTAAILCHVLGIHLIWRIAKGSSTLSADSFALGALCALAWAARPAALVLIVPALVALQGKRRYTTLFAGLVSVGLPVIWMNLHFYHGYAMGWRGVVATMTAGSTKDFLMAGNLPLGLLGILFSPNRGAIVFFPLLLFTPFLWARLFPSLALHEVGRDLLRLRVPVARGKALNGIPPAFSLAMACGAVAYLLSIARLEIWHGSWGYGPRYLYDIQPFVWPVITLAIAEGLKLWDKKGKIAIPRAWVALLLIFSVQGVVIHALGHFNYDLYVWNHSQGEITNRSAWDFRDLMLKSVWDAGLNRERRGPALERLKNYGF